MVHEDRLIRCRVTIERQFYPKNNQPIEDGEFGIVSARVTWFDESYATPVTHPVYKTITIKGAMPALTPGSGKEYLVQAYETESDYGISYTVKLMNENVVLETREQQYAFLSQILTERQVMNLFHTFEKPIDIIKAGQHERLLEVPGIGEVALQKMLKKIVATEDLAIVYAELAHYELTQREIQELVAHYHNTTLLVSEFKKNPYVLMEYVSRVGFSRADQVALRGNFNRKSPLRVKAFVLDYLNTQAEQGNSWVHFEHLLQAIEEQFVDDAITLDVISKALKDLVKKKLMWHNEDKTKIGLQSIYELEREVARELLRLNGAKSEFDIANWEAIIKAQEQRQGWSYTEEQRDGIETILKNNVVLVQGLAGCLSADHEYFNGKEWKKISEYEAGEKVLQYHEDGTTSLTQPIKYHKNKRDEFYELETKKGISLCVSDDHRIPFINSSQQLEVKTMEEIKTIHEQNKTGFKGAFITSFSYSGKGIDLTDAEIRLMCAVVCDGHFRKTTSSKRCIVRLKKERKKQRLERLLTQAGISYLKRLDSAEGYHRYVFEAPLRAKAFDESWYECSQHQLQVIASEILNWDGTQTQTTKQFSTTSKETADFIQFVFTATGKRATIKLDDRTGQTYIASGKTYTRNSICYRVLISERTQVKMSKSTSNTESKQIKKVASEDGYEYCFSVPSEMFVTRRKGRIVVVNNCGKTATVAGMLAVLGDKYEITSCALAGKAAVNISDSVAQNGLTLEGKTIHRLLKNKGQANAFGYNKDFQLPEQVIILDEVSMVDLRIFLALIQAIKTGSKLIMLGDNGQLPSIGLGNLMTDLIHSDLIKTVTLTKVHRQAAKSGIISESLKIRQGIDLVSKQGAGLEVRGELQDLVLDTTMNQSEVFNKIIHHFKEEWSKLDNIMDILVVLPMRERGSSSVYKVNNAIQNILFPNTFLRGYPVNEGKSNAFKIYKGDKVLCTKNDYEVITPDGSETAIFNGNLGIVKEIDFNNLLMLVDFEGIGEVILNHKQIETLSLGYAISIHKSQGTGVPVVITAFTMESWILLSKQLVYTAITRAKRKAIVVGEVKALKTAAKKNSVINKQTFLGFLLNNQPL